MLSPGGLEAPPTLLVGPGYGCSLGEVVTYFGWQLATLSIPLAALNQSATLPLFECIGGAGAGEMKKGSPGDYHAETSCFEQLAQKSQSGEPNDCYSLYRIGRTQENNQLLHQGGGWPNCPGRQVGRYTARVARMGEGATCSLAWRHGSHTIQRLDLRHTKAPMPSGW